MANARVAYVLKVFPRFSQTFVLNEILAHESAGLPLEIFSMRLTDDVRFHEALARVQSPVTQVPKPAGKAALLLERIHATARYFPRVWQVMADNPEVIASDLQQALHLACLVREKGIRHLHAHFGTIGTTTARLAAAIAGITYSFTAHAKDIYHESVDENVLRRKLADAAGVITVSDFNIRYLRDKYGADAEHVVHINNGLPLEQFPFEEPVGRSPLILAVGRLVEKKGFQFLVEACGRLRDRGKTYRCEIIGGGEQASELAGQIEQLGLGEQVKLLGPQPQGEVRRKLHEASMMAAPCIVAGNDDRDGLPTVLLEAMAMGTPCISTDVTGIPEILSDGETGLSVRQRDAEGLANACARLLDDPAQGVYLARNARRQIEDRFDIVRNAARIRDFIDGIISGQDH